MFLWQGSSSRLHISKHKNLLKEKEVSSHRAPTSSADSCNWLNTGLRAHHYTAGDQGSKRLKNLRRLEAQSLALSCYKHQNPAFTPKSFNYPPKLEGRVQRWCHPLGTEPEKWLPCSNVLLSYLSKQDHPNIVQLSARALPSMHRAQGLLSQHHTQGFLVNTPYREEDIA